MTTAAGRGEAAAPAGTARVTLKTVSLRDFRNIAAAELEWPSDGIALVGENGHGKTNLLEAIAYLALLRSMRGVRDRDLLRFGTHALHVAIEADASRATRVSVGVDRAGRKRVSLDGVEPLRLADALGAVPSVCFSPADVALISGGPTSRRRFLDIALALSSPRYLGALRLYRAALIRRNAALRQTARVGERAAAVSAWEPAMAQHGAVLLGERLAWVAAVGREFTRLCADIGEGGLMQVSYDSHLATLASPHDLETALAEALARGRALDVRRGVTHAGPHRDDLAMTLDGRDLRTVGSAGQQRTAAISLRLLEAATLRERIGVQPVLLLDDPFAELDRRRAARVLALLDGMSARGLAQTVLCVPRADDIPVEFTRLERWRVIAGTFERP